MAVKSVEQQATLVLHRQRQLLVKMRTMQLNALRGMLYEFGAVFPKGVMPCWAKCSKRWTNCKTYCRSWSAKA